ncbi:hypothetical protein UFOVP2_21 [uncultured Caudovirales phage]|uniref:Uncharacterized protein n=1 Tax=uncultured Caudovirales phage TaxID=2100421 RepID=A0A6J5KHH7_9CAUD|nr:hypothetical protein UFOVP2_21 [uncultured Caudovirales phage]
MATRTKIKTLIQDSTSVQINAKAEKARKAASKAALKAATTTTTTPEPESKPEPVVADRSAENAANALAAHRADYQALYYPEGDDNGEDPYGSFEAYLAAQGVQVDGTPAKDTAKTPYNGPMLALKTARIAYVKAKNGIQCNGDRLAKLCGEHTREETVAALILAMNLGHNPYLHLNPGQQSMNLRNKARHQVSNGMLSFAAIEKAYKAG